MSGAFFLDKKIIQSVYKKIGGLRMNKFLTADFFENRTVLLTVHF